MAENKKKKTTVKPEKVERAKTAKVSSTSSKATKKSVAKVTAKQVKVEKKSSAKRPAETKKAPVKPVAQAKPKAAPKQPNSSNANAKKTASVPTHVKKTVSKKTKEIPTDSSKSVKGTLAPKKSSMKVAAATVKTSSAAGKPQAIAPSKKTLPKQSPVPSAPRFSPIPTSKQTQEKKKAKVKQRFSAADLLAFKKELLALRDMIQGRSGDMKNAALKGVDDINPEEDGTDAFLRLQTLDQVRNQHKDLVKINEALRAIEDGTYGVCSNCGELIRKQRLAVLPFAKNCIKCQSEIERQNRRR